MRAFRDALQCKLLIFPISQLPKRTSIERAFARHLHLPVTLGDPRARVPSTNHPHFALPGPQIGIPVPLSSGALPQHKVCIDCATTKCISAIRTDGFRVGYDPGCSDVKRPRAQPL